MDPLEEALLKIAKKGGFKVTRVSFSEMARLKEQSRLQDDELIRSGQATPEEIQAKNDISGGKVKVLDWSSMFA